MTGLEFEKQCVNALASQGYWAHRFGRAENGSQPFDLIALKGNKICAYDCKVISTKDARFDFKRIEENQKYAMELIKQKANMYQVGFLVWHNDKVYFVDYEQTKTGNSIRLVDSMLFM